MKHIVFLIAMLAVAVTTAQIDTNFAVTSFDAAIDDSQVVNAEVGSFLSPARIVHITWVRDTENIRTIMYSNYNIENNTFSTPVEVDSQFSADTKIAPFILVDSQDGVHIAYIVRRDDSAGTRNANFAVMYAYSADGSSFALEQVSTNPQDPAVDDDGLYNCGVNGRPNILLDPANNPTVTYYADANSNTSFDNYIIFAEKSGNSWNYSQEMNADAAPDLYDLDDGAAMTFNLGSSNYIGFGDDEPVYAYKSNASWTFEVIPGYTGAFNNDYVEVNDDLDGNVYYQWYSESNDRKRFCYTQLINGAYQSIIETPELTHSVGGNFQPAAIDPVDGSPIFYYQRDFTDKRYFILQNESENYVEYEVEDNGVVYGRNALHIYDGQIALVTASESAQKIFVTVNSGNTDANSSPRISDQEFNVTADIQNGTSVGFVQADDPNGDPITFRFTNSQDIVSIDQNSGEIVMINSANIEVGNRFDFTVEVSDGELAATASIVITVQESIALDASFTSNAQSAELGEVIQFSDQSTGEPNSWNWTFQGGTPETSTDQNPSIQYTTAGTYDVSLTVSDGTESDTETITGFIEVIDPNSVLSAAFESSSRSVQLNQSVQFIDQSTGEPTSWNWTFEGGTPSSSTQQNPEVTYSQEGFFDVTLVVGDGTETSELVETDFIEVVDVPSPDIAISSFSVLPTSQFRGEDVVLSTEFLNSGAVDIEGAVVFDLYLSLDGSIDEEDQLLARSSFTGLVVDVSKTIETTVNIPLETAVGRNFIIVQADPDNNILEEVEANNGTLTTLTVDDIIPIVVNPLEDVDLQEGFSSTNIDVTTVFEDPDGDALTYQVQSDDTGVVSASLSGNNVILTERGIGFATVTITANDNEDGSVSDSFLVTVNSTGNSRPTVSNPIDDINLLEGFVSENVDLTVVFADEDGDNLTLTIVDFDGTSVNGTISSNTLTLTEQNIGTTSFTIRADDGNGGLVSTSFDVNVTTNVAPIVRNPLADETITEGFGSERISLVDVFSDADGDDLTYTATSSDELVATVTVSNDDLVILEEGNGTTTITVFADDGKGGTVSDDFTFTIDDVNEAPILQNPIPDLAFEPGFVSAVVELDTVFFDPDGDTFDYTVESSNTNVATVEISNTSIIITERGEGSSEITIVADDGRGESVNDVFSVLNQGNNAPTVQNPIEDQVLSQGFVTTSISFDDVFDDPDEDDLTYSVESSDEDVLTATISGTNLVFIEQSSIGTVSITLTANDGRNGLVSDIFNVSIVENSIPFVANAIDDQALEQGFSSFNLSIANVFADNDGDILSFESSSNDQSIVSTSINGFSLSILERGLGSTEVSVTASDGKGGQAGTSFQITVEERALFVKNKNSLVYPTIVNGIVTISAEKEILSSVLVKLDGSETKRFSNETSLSMDGLSDGVYVLTIQFIDKSEEVVKVILR